MGRDIWKSRRGFIFASIGAAVGLGNLWRFPFKAYENGGGAFILPYIVALLTCAIPLMIMEFSIGRKLRAGSTKVFATINKKFEVVGWVQVMIPIIVMMFYSTIISISIIFMVYCLGQVFGFMDPWMSNIAHVMVETLPVVPESQFDISTGISTKLAIAVVFVWIANFMIVRSGISNGIEKISKVFVPILIVLMVMFMVNSLRLSGAGLGMEKLFTPDFSALADSSIWLAAYSQVFFSTTVAVGVMIAYGSYIGDKDDIVNSAFITVLANSSFDIIAGITVFTTLGFLVNSMGIPFDAFSGSSVAFVAFPVAITNMTSNVVLQGLIGFIFFFSLFIAGISSSISMLESFTTAALDKFKISREKMVMIVSIVGFAGSLLFATYVGMNSPDGVKDQAILDIVDEFVSENLIAIVGLIEVILISWFYGTEKLRNHANEYSDFRIGKVWDILLKYVTPALLGLVVVSNLINSAKVFGDLDSTTRVAHIVFGWGTVAIMVAVSVILTSKKWKEPLTVEDKAV